MFCTRGVTAKAVLCWWNILHPKRRKQFASVLETCQSEYVITLIILHETRINTIGNVRACVYINNLTHLFTHKRLYCVNYELSRCVDAVITFLSFEIRGVSLILFMHIMFPSLIFIFEISCFQEILWQKQIRYLQNERLNFKIFQNRHFFKLMAEMSNLTS